MQVEGCQNKGGMKMEEKNIGSDFDEFLREEGILEGTQEVAVKRVLAYQIEKSSFFRGYLIAMPISIGLWILIIWALFKIF